MITATEAKKLSETRKDKHYVEVIEPYLEVIERRIKYTCENNEVKVKDLFNNLCLTKKEIEEIVNILKENGYTVHHGVVDDFYYTISWENPL